ncbi:MAG: hypothetical protein WA191_17725 [Telluria sp.]
MLDAFSRVTADQHSLLVTTLDAIDRWNLGAQNAILIYPSGQRHYPTPFARDFPGQIEEPGPALGTDRQAAAGLWSGGVDDRRRGKRRMDEFQAGGRYANDDRGRSDSHHGNGSTPVDQHPAHCRAR